MLRVEGGELDGLYRAQHHAVSFARRGVGRNDQDIPVAIERLHAVARHFESVSVLVVNAGEADLIPAPADGKAAVVEEAAGSSLGQADQRDGLRGFSQSWPLVEQVHELIERGPGG